MTQPSPEAIVKLIKDAEETLVRIGHEFASRNYLRAGATASSRAEQMEQLQIDHPSFYNTLARLYAAAGSCYLAGQGAQRISMARQAFERALTSVESLRPNAKYWPLIGNLYLGQAAALLEYPRRLPEAYDSVNASYRYLHNSPARVEPAKSLILRAHIALLLGRSQHEVLADLEKASDSVNPVSIYWAVNAQLLFADATQNRKYVRQARHLLKMLEDPLAMQHYTSLLRGNKEAYCELIVPPREIYS